MADPVSAAALRLAQIREQLDRYNRGDNQHALRATYREDVAYLLAALARAEQTIRALETENETLTRGATQRSPWGTSRTASTHGVESRDSAEQEPDR